MRTTPRDSGEAWWVSSATDCLRVESESQSESAPLVAASCSLRVHFGSPRGAFTSSLRAPEANPNGPSASLRHQPNGRAAERSRRTTNHTNEAEGHSLRAWEVNERLASSSSSLPGPGSAGLDSPRLSFTGLGSARLHQTAAARLQGPIKPNSAAARRYRHGTDPHDT